jgi:methyl-accepting chemotaxis protein
MDKVTQSNAASAEQCASASEKLSEEAEALKGVVGDLIALVTGASGQQAAARSAHSPRRQIAAPARRAPGKPPISAAPKQLAEPKVMKPNEVIPLDNDGDFRDF